MKVSEQVEKIVHFINENLISFLLTTLFIALLLLSIVIPYFLGSLGISLDKHPTLKALLEGKYYIKIAFSFILTLLYFFILPKVIGIEFNLKKLNEKLKEITSLLEGNSALIKPSKHPEIWDGFVNTYYVVNAPWQLERYMDTMKYRDMVNLHVERYKNPDLKESIYIFFKNTEFKDSFRNFAQFIKDVLQEYPEAAKKIKILISEGDPVNYSLFLGEKKFRPEHTKFKSPVGEKTLKKPDETISYSIVYIHDRPFTNRDGYPSWAVVSINSDINQVLRQYVEDLIHNSDCREIAVSDFIERFGS